MTPRVVRFDDEPASAPDRAAPVARFGDGSPDPKRPDPAEDPAAGEDASVEMFDRLDAPAAAPVATMGEPAARPFRDPDGADGDAAIPAASIPAAEIVDIAGIGGAPAPVFRAVELTGLGPGRRRSTASKPRSSRRGASSPAATADSADPADQVRGGRWATTDRGAAGSAVVAPVDDEEPAPTDQPRRPGRSEGGGARRGGGGFGRRGAPTELDPDADPVAVAKEVCLRLLSDRARTRQELADALRRKGVPDDAAHTVLERFDEVGLIDDAAFAGQWVRSRHNHRGLARRAIAMELRRKGVDDEVASEALEEVDQESEERRARELVDRKLRTVPADTPEQRKKAATRLVGMLARKGYGGGIAYRVVREALAAHGAEIDELGTDPVD